MINVIYEQLKDNIMARENVDKPLMNWFFIVFVLSWLTCGVVPIYMFIKRILRVDKYLNRKKEFFDIVIHFVEIKAEENKEENYEKNILFLKNRLQVFNSQVKPIMTFVIKFMAPAVTFTIFIVLFIAMTDTKKISVIIDYIIFIWILYVLIVLFTYIYKMNRIWDDIQNFEKDMYDSISQIFISLNLLHEPIPYDTDPHLKKDFHKYSALVVLVLGIWLIVWDYLIHVAPDKMYITFHKAEDTVMEVVKENCIRQ